MAIEFSVDQTIAALASPPGGAARGIVRISGIGVRDVLADWFIPDDVETWRNCRIPFSHVGNLDLRSDGPPVHVSVQVLLWPGRRSYTGQPLAELHLPGSPCLLETVLGEIYRRGVRPARPGEFTLRSFLAGKLDLLQAEAVLGVIDAQDHVELQVALSQLAGGISGPLSGVRQDLLELLADLEAGLDFIEEDIEFVSRQNVLCRLEEARRIVGQLQQQTTDRMQSRIRPKVVLAGLPNAGKSTLFNRIAGDQHALVSPEKGTTRDFLSRPVTWSGLSFDLIDTAGWEDKTTGLAAVAQHQRAEQMHRADLVIWCTSATLDPAEIEFDTLRFDAAKQEVSASIRLLTKVDLVPQVADSCTSAGDRIGQTTTFPISVNIDFGVKELMAQIRLELSRIRGSGGQWLGMTAARCRETLASVATSLERADQAARIDAVGDELIAADLRCALDQLGSILGVIYTDDVLDRVFSKFCIGK